MDSELNNSTGPIQNSADEMTPTGKLSLRQEIHLRKEFEKQKEASQYTFKPAINASKNHRDSDPKSKENRFTKLYTDALKRHVNNQNKEDHDVRVARELTNCSNSFDRLIPFNSPFL
jgi:hypothetical protein